MIRKGRKKKKKEEMIVDDTVAAWADSEYIWISSNCSTFLGFSYNDLSICSDLT